MKPGTGDCVDSVGSGLNANGDPERANQPPVHPRPGHAGPFIAIRRDKATGRHYTERRLEAFALLGSGLPEVGIFGAANLDETGIELNTLAQMEPVGDMFGVA